MEVKIYYEDTDAGGVVYYANYLRYFERARVDHLTSLGVNVKELEEKGIFFVVVRTEADFCHPARLYDTLNVGIKISEIKKVSFWTDYVITRKGEETVLVRGRCKIVCVDANLKIIRIPEEVMEKLGRVSL